MQPFKRVRWVLTSVGSAMWAITDWVGQFPSMAFGFGYLAAVPLFALVYTIVPYDFYNATARYEPFVVGQAQSIATRLRDAFLRDARQSGAGRPSLNGVPVPESHDGVFPIFLIQPEPDLVRIQVQFVTINVPDVKNVFLKVGLDLDQSSTITSDSVSKDGYLKMSVLVEVRTQVLSGDKVQLSALFPCGRDHLAESTCLRMTMEDYSSLLSLANTAAGRPTAMQGSYLRMLYFSAVTMSTLGYGDIVPVTTRSRALVTVQVILGPILFALFLNALVKERRPTVGTKANRSDSADTAGRV